MAINWPCVLMLAGLRQSFLSISAMITVLARSLGVCCRIAKPVEPSVLPDYGSFAVYLSPGARVNTGFQSVIVGCRVVQIGNEQKILCSKPENDVKTVASRCHQVFIIKKEQIHQRLMFSGMACS